MALGSEVGTRFLYIPSPRDSTPGHLSGRAQLPESLRVAGLVSALGGRGAEGPHSQGTAVCGEGRPAGLQTCRRDREAGPPAPPRSCRAQPEESRPARSFPSPPRAPCHSPLCSEL